MNSLRCGASRAVSRSSITTRTFSTHRVLRQQAPKQTAEDHATRKNHELDPQAKGVADGQKSKAAASTGAADNATGSTDARGTAQRTKKEFPEAPDTVIGMQDERGKRE